MDSQNSWNLEWNPAPGARLPSRGDGVVLKSQATFGSGTHEDPCVLYKCPLQFSGAELEEFNKFAQGLCRDLGFTYIWIRAFVHDWKTKRDTITAHRTGGIQKGEDPHITVYLSNRADWINVHGDIYVETRNIDRKRKMPIGLTRTERMKLHGDKQPRNPRLYVWTEKDTGRTTEKHNMAMAARSWRGNVNR